MALGERLQLMALTVRGALDEATWARTLNDLATALGMTPVASPVVWRYPLNGKGGVGFTAVQPITESFLVSDVWPDHGGAYLLVASCKPFRASTVKRFLRKAGVHPYHREFAETLTLRPRGAVAH